MSDAIRNELHRLRQLVDTETKHRQAADQADARRIDALSDRCHALQLRVDNLSTSIDNILRFQD